MVRRCTRDRAKREAERPQSEAYLRHTLAKIAKGHQINRIDQ